MKRSTLNIQTEGLSKLKVYSLEILNHILPQLELLKGVKIINMDGSKAKKNYNIKPYERPNDSVNNVYTSYQYYIDFGSSIWLNVKICINGGSYDDNTAYTNYFEQSYYIGTMEQDGMTLKAVEPIEKVKEYNILSSEYTEEGLNDLINQFEAAKKTASKLFHQIPEQVRQAKFLNRNI